MTWNERYVSTYSWTLKIQEICIQGLFCGDSLSFFKKIFVKLTKEENFFVFTQVFIIEKREINLKTFVKTGAGYSYRYCVIWYKVRNKSISRNLCDETVKFSFGVSFFFWKWFAKCLSFLFSFSPCILCVLTEYSIIKENFVKSAYMRIMMIFVKVDFTKLMWRQNSVISTQLQNYSALCGKTKK